MKFKNKKLLPKIASIFLSSLTCLPLTGFAGDGSKLSDDTVQEVLKFLKPEDRVTLQLVNKKLEVIVKLMNERLYADKSYGFLNFLSNIMAESNGCEFRAFERVSFLDDKRIPNVIDFLLNSTLIKETRDLMYIHCFTYEDSDIDNVKEIIAGALDRFETSDDAIAFRKQYKDVYRVDRPWLFSHCTYLNPCMDADDCLLYLCPVAQKFQDYQKYSRQDEYNLMAMNYVARELESRDHDRYCFSVDELIYYMILVALEENRSNDDNRSVSDMLKSVTDNSNWRQLIAVVSGILNNVSSNIED